MYAYFCFLNTLGFDEGFRRTGLRVGFLEGRRDGDGLDFAVGRFDGFGNGFTVGIFERRTDGLVVGADVALFSSDNL
jgi:hypothetical protein